MGIECHYLIMTPQTYIHLLLRCNSQVIFPHQLLKAIQIYLFQTDGIIPVGMNAIAALLDHLFNLLIIFLIIIFPFSLQQLLLIYSLKYTKNNVFEWLFLIFASFFDVSQFPCVRTQIISLKNPKDVLSMGFVLSYSAKILIINEIEK